jgi:hypothetical protein
MQQYLALTAGAAVVDLSQRTQLEFTGVDRAKFLHNLCTNAVQNLPAGSGCEAFVLNVKGHIVSHVWIFAGPNSLVVETVPDQAEKLLAYFERYLIRDDVQIFDRSQEWAELLLVGSLAEAILTAQISNPSSAFPQDRLSHCAVTIAGVPVWLRKVDWVGANGYLLAYRRESSPTLQRTMIEAGATSCDSEAFDTVRIERGTPWFGRDITEQNLPQEIDRDRQCISFTKGCYLGQETVARIDALGHVNRLLRGARFVGDVIPTPGMELRSAEGEKTVGHVTSACWSPNLSAPLALAIVSRGHHSPGARLESEIGVAEIVDLPLAPRGAET